MPLVSRYAQKKKIRYFLKDIPKDAHILEVGCGSRWVSDYFKSNGYLHYTGLDLESPADIVGDIRDWRQLGLQPRSFDYIIAFEVVEHVDMFSECHELLKDDGQFLITTPIPERDWILKVFEFFRLNQRRTSVHDHLTDLRTITLFKPLEYKRIAMLSQWGKFVKRN